MDRKRILFIVEAMGGGIFSYIVDLANELVKEYEMHIAFAVRNQTPINYEEYFDKRIHLIKVKNFGREIVLGKDLRAFSEIKKIAKEIRPDVIHLHSSKAGALGRVAFSVGRTPLFYTPHGYSFLMDHHSAKKRFVYKMIESVCGKLNCMTISCGSGEHEETLKLNKQATYVNNGINLDKIQAILNQAVQKSHPFTVFTLGRICHQKNPTSFNQVAKVMSRVKFVWIGDGELREELTAPNIEITGWVEREIAIQKALNADAFMLTSRWEGLPISLLEAMYMKKPCVVSDVIGNHDVIQTGRNGYVCKDTQDFVVAIQKIQDDNDGEILKMVETAYQDILDNYNTRVMARKYSEIYRGGLNSTVLTKYYFLNACSRGMTVDSGRAVAA